MMSSGNSGLAAISVIALTAGYLLFLVLSRIVEHRWVSAGVAWDGKRAWGCMPDDGKKTKILFARGGHTTTVDGVRYRFGRIKSQKQMSLQEVLCYALGWNIQLDFGTGKWISTVEGCDEITGHGLNCPAFFFRNGVAVPDLKKLVFGPSVMLGINDRVMTESTFGALTVAALGQIAAGNWSVVEGSKSRFTAAMTANARAAMRLGKWTAYSDDMIYERCTVHEDSVSQATLTGTATIATLPTATSPGLQDYYRGDGTNDAHGSLMVDIAVHLLFPRRSRHRSWRAFTFPGANGKGNWSATEALYFKFPEIMTRADITAGVHANLQQTITHIAARNDLEITPSILRALWQWGWTQGRPGGAANASVGTGNVHKYKLAYHYSFTPGLSDEILGDLEHDTRAIIGSFVNAANANRGLGQGQRTAAARPTLKFFV